MGGWKSARTSSCRPSCKSSVYTTHTTYSSVASLSMVGSLNDPPCSSFSDNVPRACAAKACAELPRCHAAHVLALEVFGDSAPILSVLLESVEPVLYLLGPHYADPPCAGRGGLVMLLDVVVDIGIHAQCNCVLEQQVHLPLVVVFEG